MTHQALGQLKARFTIVFRGRGASLPVEPGVPQATTVGLDAHLEEALALADRHRLDLHTRQAF